MVAYLIEMWLLKYDKCIYLNSNLVLCIPVSFCGFKHYTRNRMRTSWMTFQDLNSASWDSLPNFPLAPTEIALCTAARWQGKVKLSAWFVQSQFAVGYVHPTSTLQTLTQTPDLQQRGLWNAFFTECLLSFRTPFLSSINATTGW